VLQEFELEKLTVREQEVGFSPVVRGLNLSFGPLEIPLVTEGAREFHLQIGDISVDIVRFTMFGSTEEKKRSQAVRNTPLNSLSKVRTNSKCKELPVENKGLGGALFNETPSTPVVFMVRGPLSGNDTWRLDASFCTMRHIVYSMSHRIC
jgi:hypothetical protein